MANDNYTKGKDLTKERPVSPKLVLGGYVILARTIDKCRALLWGNIGEYRYDCAVDNQLFGFKNITGDALKAFVAEGHSNEEIAAWVNTQGTPRSQSEKDTWNAQRVSNNMSSEPAQKKAWLEGVNEKLGLPKDGTLFDMLLADDAASIPEAKIRAKK